MKRPPQLSLLIGWILFMPALGRAQEPLRPPGPPGRLLHELQAVQEMVETLDTGDAKAKGKIIERLEKIRDAVSRHMDSRSKPGGGGHRRLNPLEAERLTDELERITAIIKENKEAGRETPKELLRSKLRLERRQRDLRRFESFRSGRRGPRKPRRGPDRPRRGPIGPEHGGAFGQVSKPPSLPRELGHPHGPLPPPPTDEDNPESFFEIMEKIAPERAKEARKGWEKNPREFRHRMRRMIPELRRLRHLREQDPEAFERAVEERKHEWKIRHLAERARRNKGEERERQTAELREQLNQLFDVRMRNRDAKITQIQSELEKLRADQDRRRDQRDSLIQRRYEELLGESLEF